MKVDIGTRMLAFVIVLALLGTSPFFIGGVSIGAAALFYIGSKTVGSILIGIVLACLISRFAMSQVRFY